MTQTAPLLAAIRYTRDDAIDELLETLVRGFQARGMRVAGFIQRETEAGPDCCATTQLEDVTTGEWHLISQALGSGAKGCRLDPQALALLCARLEDELARGAGLLVINRFGRGESEGHGFRAAIERALLAGIPVLAAVQDGYLPAWQAFVGDCGTTLPAARAEIEAWAAAVLPVERA